MIRSSIKYHGNQLIVAMTIDHKFTLGGKLSQQSKSSILSMVEVSSCIRGLHVYKCMWEPCIGEELLCSPQMNNPHDCYAVAVYKSGVIVGHVPKVISRLFWLFLNKPNTVIQCFVTGPRRH